MKYTTLHFQHEFLDDDACLAYIFNKKYSRLPDFNKYYKVRDRKCYAHSETGIQIHPTAGTVFHKSSTKLSLWFYAIHLFAASKNGVSAKELQRQLGVTYKCAYRIGQQIRALMVEEIDIFTGTLEADEIYFDDKWWNNKRSRWAENKTPIIGVDERNSSIVT